LSRQPLISFGVIVLNGEPFTKYCLRSLYPFAHEIIVVEGAVSGAASFASSDGHSTDGTLQALNEFKVAEDPAGKVKLVIRDGFWTEKDEMSQAYARLATGNYLWQVDIDEFYKPHDMERIVAFLQEDPSISAVSFKQIQFWGGFSFYVDSWYLKTGGEQFHRLFRWGDNYTYKTHRPPTVITPAGIDNRSLNWLGACEMERRGIFVYHYSLVFPRQVAEKCRYYADAHWSRRSKAPKWADEAYTSIRRPFRVHNVYHYPGWLERFFGEHPCEIEALRTGIQTGKVEIAMRPTNDIETLLDAWWYKVGRTILRHTSGLGWLIRAWLVGKKILIGLVDNVLSVLRLAHRKTGQLFIHK
jgi:hypothetical protein